MGNKSKAKGNWDFYATLRIKLESLLNDVTDLPYEQFFGFLFSEKEQVTHIVVGPQMPEGLYRAYAFTLEDGEWKRLKAFPPHTILYSRSLSDNYSAPVPPESDIKRPVILDSNGQQVLRTAFVYRDLDAVRCVSDSLGQIHPVSQALLFSRFR